MLYFGISKRSYGSRTILPLFGEAHNTFPMNEKKRILILSVSAGSGHVSVAAALEEEFRRQSPKSEVRNVDVLDYTNILYKDVYTGGYASLIHYAPKIWGQLYGFLDKKEEDSIRKKVVSFLDRLNSQKLLRMIKEFAPDHIISTHFFSTGVLQTFTSRFIRSIPHSVVITDYDIHALWVRPHIHSYFVASDLAKWSLVHKMKVDESKVFVTGIPVRRKFLTLGKTQQTIRRELGFDGDKAALLILSGGLGVGRLPKIIDAILSMKRSCHMAIITGKNDALRRRLQKKRFPKFVTKKVLGFVDNIHEYMKAADIVVSKAGGLTVTECMVLGKPLLIIAPVPGQEEINTDFVQEQGIGYEAYDEVQLQFKLQYMLDHPDILMDMSQKASGIAKPHASEEVVARILKRSL